MCSLSSLSLTEIFPEPSNGSFSVPAAGTFPALSKSNQKIEVNGQQVENPRINGLQVEGIDSRAAVVKSQKETRQHKGSSVITTRKEGIWKPPDWGLPLQCQNKQWRRGVRMNREMGRLQAVLNKPYLGQSGELLQPRARVEKEEKHSRGRSTRQRPNEDLEKKANHQVPGGVIATSRRGRAFKKEEGSRKESTTPYLARRRRSLFLLLQSLLTNKKPPKSCLHRKQSKRSKMEINELTERAGRLSTERSNPSSSGGKGARPQLSTISGRGISMLLGKMLTENKVALAKASGAARYAWGKYEEVGVQPTQAQNLFIFTFKDAKTREKIWLERPWSLSNTMTALTKYEGRGDPEAVPMNKLAVWVQIHGLHQSQRCEQNIISIGTFYFSKFIDMDRASLHFNGYRRFIRMLVEIEVSEPVPTGFDFPFTDEATGREYCEDITFKYERLVELCYFCGRIGHNWPTCSRMKEERRKGGHVQLSDIYTAELKAGIESPYRSSGSKNRIIEEEQWSPATDPEAWRENYSSGGFNEGRDLLGTAEFSSARREEEIHPKIPPGFTVRRLEAEARAEEGSSRVRGKGKYREGMGARDLAVDLEVAAAELQGRLCLEEEEESHRQTGGRAEAADL
ncbi:unnamed protein product [Linum trigynum]|uniref:Zinc knuckle CX2CX4HX4C domain-containing protein n=1 Tax=Linum trigynum TaxID=586398 RepID=A0AAV2CS43_9ROSI